MVVHPGEDNKFIDGTIVPANQRREQRTNIEREDQVRSVCVHSMVVCVHDTHTCTTFCTLPMKEQPEEAQRRAVL